MLGEQSLCSRHIPVLLLLLKSLDDCRSNAQHRCVHGIGQVLPCIGRPINASHAPMDVRLFYEPLHKAYGPIRSGEVVIVVAAFAVVCVVPVVLGQIVIEALCEVFPLKPVRDEPDPLVVETLLLLRCSNEASSISLSKIGISGLEGGLLKLNLATWTERFSCGHR